MSGKLLEGTSGAIFSPCRTWRYALWRTWPIVSDRLVVFICLNPSTADETQDDPTIRRCIGYAQRWGYGGVIILNIFAFRGTDPRDMMAAPDPVGPENDPYIDKVASLGHDMIAAWGVHGAFLHRGKAVMARIPRLMCLGQTQEGHPKHPLYLKGDLEFHPMQYNRA